MSNGAQGVGLKLSICITTLNRGAFIAATLDSILPQLTGDCEIVVLDAASIDNTESVLTEYASRFGRLRYLRQNTNNGVDRDYDRVVELARGEYCWLMTDDDLLKPGAIATVLRALQGDVSLVMVNVESKDFHMATVVHRRWVSFSSDRRYGSGEMDRLFIDAQDLVRYIGCVIVKRAVWLERRREQYFGTWWIYVGVIFQAPLPGDAIVVAEPLISYRMSNVHTFSARAGELLLSCWPTLARSLAVSKTALDRVASAEPWKHFEWLLFLRAMGAYSLPLYRTWIRQHLRLPFQMFVPVLAAVFPPALANALLVAYHSLRQNERRLSWLRDSRFHFSKWRIVGRNAQGSPVLTR